MPRSKKFSRLRLLVVLVVLLLVAGVAFGGWYGVRQVNASYPQTTGTIHLQGLSGPVDVDRDDKGIPQVYASSAQDLFMAQGYVQAQDRFWQMDVNRHITSGTLASMFGSGQVQTDAFIRTMNWRGVAQQEWDTQLSATTKKYLQAYSDGVNAWLKDHPGGAGASLEYALLGTAYGDYKPAAWTPVDSISWLKAMAWDLSGNMQQEVDRSLLAGTFSAQQIAELYPAYPTSNGTIIAKTGKVAKDGNYVPADGLRTPTGSAGSTGSTGGASSGNGTTVPASYRSSADRTGGQQAAEGAQTAALALADNLKVLPTMLGRPGAAGIGSNSWVVDGRHTTTGKPLLANDPHLAPGMPSIWYQMGLHCRTLSKTCTYDVAGYTFAGMPGVVIGHNTNVAWGFTNLGADVTDLYLEKVTGPDTYQVDGKDMKFTTRKETIKVAGGADRTITVRTTNHGPLISDQSSEQQNVGKDAPVLGGNVVDRGNGYGVALEWTALTPGKTMDAVFKLDRAANWTDFQSAAQDFAVPAQNLIYADTKGNIGYQAPGQIPVRAKGDGTRPVPGWDSAYKWAGYIPFKALPYSYNPTAGYIITANQAVVDPSYKYTLTKDWEYGTRAREITDQIQAKLKNGGKISPGDMKDIQLDNTSVMAQTLVPLLLKVKIDDPYVREAQDLLKDWNFHQDADSAAAAYYNGIWRQLLTLAFGQKFPADLRAEGDCLLVRKKDTTLPDDALGGAVQAVTECGTRKPSQAQPDGGDRWTEVVRQQLTQPDSPWWDYIDSNHVQQHGLGNLLAEAMKDARQDLTARLSKDINTWSWGRLHTLTLKEQTLGTDDSSIASGLVHKLLNRGPYKLSGSTAAVDAAGWNAAAGYEVDWIPSMRMVVDLNNLDDSRWINVGGASGHAFHPNYNDQTDLWVKGDLLPWAFSADAVGKAAKHTMTLTP